MSPQYNNQAKAVEVLVSKGQAIFIRECEKLEDIFKATHQTRSTQ